MSKIQYSDDFAFYQQLKLYYDKNRKKIRSRYNSLTKKFLDYNDKESNPDAYLRLPQFEALEIYVFIKEFMDNPHVFEMFDDWRKSRNKFADASYYSVNRNGQLSIFDTGTEAVTDVLFKQMKKYEEKYPNYASLSVEKIIERNPQAVMLITHGEPEAVREAFDKEMAQNAAWKNLDAVKNGKVTILPSDLFGTNPGTRIIEALEEMKKQLEAVK